MKQNPIPWLVDKIFEFDPSLLSITVIDYPELTPEQWMALRIKWAVDLGFVTFQWDHDGSPSVAICVRPVNEDILDRITLDYPGSIWEFDPFGHILFFDFRYGKGTFPLCWDLARASGRTDIAWFYRQRIRRYKMEDIPRIKGWQGHG